MKQLPTYQPSQFNKPRKRIGKVLDVFIIVAELFAIVMFVWIFLGSFTYLFRLIDSTIKYQTTSDSAPISFLIGLFVAIVHATISFIIYAVNGLTKTIKRMKE